MSKKWFQWKAVEMNEPQCDVSGVKKQNLCDVIQCKTCEELYLHLSVKRNKDKVSIQYYSKYCKKPDRLVIKTH